MHMSSSSDHAELPLNQRQRQSLPGTGETTQSVQYSGDADVSDVETEFPSIEELQLPDINGSLSSIHRNVTSSDKLKWGTSQDEPILLDCDVGDSGVLDNAEREILVDLSGSQVALSDATILTTTTKIIRTAHQCRTSRNQSLPDSPVHPSASLHTRPPLIFSRTPFKVFEHVGVTAVTCKCSYILLSAYWSLSRGGKVLTTESSFATADGSNGSIPVGHMTKRERRGQVCQKRTYGQVQQK
ncbi:hypothetical protein O988_00828 [Pseudogymnoascus sp. VKM F-3808]|nr:hypothetical protein O988_00828 [Pseudogymnoascus sp. VKM F-3808]